MSSLVAAAIHVRGGILFEGFKYLERGNFPVSVSVQTVVEGDFPLTGRPGVKFCCHFLTHFPALPCPSKRLEAVTAIGRSVLIQCTVGFCVPFPRDYRLSVLNMDKSNSNEMHKFLPLSIRYGILLDIRRSDYSNRNIRNVSYQKFANEVAVV